MDHKTTGINLKLQTTSSGKPHISTPLVPKPLPTQPRKTGKRYHLHLNQFNPPVKVYSKRVCHVTCFVYLQ